MRSLPWVLAAPPIPLDALIEIYKFVSKGIAGATNTPHDSTSGIHLNILKLSYVHGKNCKNSVFTFGFCGYTQVF